MQNVYAYKQCEESDYHIAAGLIKETFAPDMNSMEVQDKAKLDEKKTKALDIFEKYYRQEIPEIEGEDGIEIKKALVDALNFYNNQKKKDFDFFRKNMVVETERIYDRYLRILLLLPEFAGLAETESEKKGKHQREGLNLARNQVLDIIANSKVLKLEAIKRNLDWSDSRDDVRQWFREIKKDEAYVSYKSLETPSFSDDKQIVSHVLKNIVFRNELVRAYFEERDLNWVENKPIVRSMALKTIKGLESASSELQLAELSPNWEDDRDFFTALFSQTIKYDDQYEALISKKTKNWDVERIALLDKIILKMAVNEMINFPSIPVKVTINEYIEISKNYSTPKSRQFINGILDVLATELIDEGVVKKSGRGLIDNK